MDFAYAGLKSKEQVGEKEIRTVECEGKKRTRKLSGTAQAE